MKSTDQHRVKYVIQNVFRPAVKDARDVRRYIASVTLFSLAAALAVDVTNHMVFFDSWSESLRSWTITTILAVCIAVPVSRAVGKANLELYFAKREAERLGRVDHLTELPNRRAFYEAIEQFSGGVIALVIADVDRFKRINDSHGHAVGDQVLKMVAGVMRKELDGLGLLARVGGEEFALACVDLPAAQIRARLQRLRQSLAATPVVFPGGSVVVTLSAGMAARSNASFDVLYAAADKALYVAKASGRDQIVDADDIVGITSEHIPPKQPRSRAS